eukprot:1612771-Prymnesium_polylepis.1
MPLSNARAGRHSPRGYRCTSQNVGFVYQVYELLTQRARAALGVGCGVTPKLHLEIEIGVQLYT